MISTYVSPSTEKNEESHAIILIQNSNYWKGIWYYGIGSSKCQHPFGATQSARPTHLLRGTSKQSIIFRIGANTMTKHPSHLSLRKIVAATAYYCFVASITTDAFVTPSFRSPSLLAPNRATLARNRVVPPSSLSFEITKNDGLSHSKGNARSATTFSSSTASSKLSSDQKSVLSVGLWCVLDIAFRRLFQRLGIATKFPSSLGGCGAVLAILLLTSKSTEKENKLHRLLSPGAALLAKWLPVFFVPSLVTLPLVGVDSLGGTKEVRSIEQL